MTKRFDFERDAPGALKALGFMATILGSVVAMLLIMHYTTRVREWITFPNGALFLMVVLAGSAIIFAILCRLLFKDIFLDLAAIARSYWQSLATNLRSNRWNRPPFEKKCELMGKQYLHTPMKKRLFDTEKEWKDLPEEEKIRFLQEEVSETLGTSSDALRIIWNQYRGKAKEQVEEEKMKSRRNKAWRLFIALLLLAAALFLIGNKVGAQPIANGNIYTKAIMRPDGSFDLYLLDLGTDEIIRFDADPAQGCLEEVSRKVLPHMGLFDAGDVLSAFICKGKSVIDRPLLSWPFFRSPRGLLDYEVTSWFPFKDQYKEYQYLFGWNGKTMDYSSEKQLVKTRQMDRAWFQALLILYLLFGAYLLWRLWGDQDFGVYMAMYGTIGALFFFGWYLHPINGFLSSALTVIMTALIILAVVGIITNIVIDRRREAE